jgi:hypothetical protein
MRLLSLTALLASAAYSQTFNVPRHLKLIPPLTSPQSSLLPAKPRLAVPVPSASAGRPCAIPLVNVLPRAANPDPAMIIQPRVTSRTPQVTLPAPPCNDGRRP